MPDVAPSATNQDGSGCSDGNSVGCGCIHEFSSFTPMLRMSTNGLYNLGNTCYLNAAVQALSNVPSIAAFFMDCPGLLERTPARSLSRKFAALVEDQWMADSGAVVPKELVAHVRGASEIFRGYGQQVKSSPSSFIPAS
jgi:ubiquitin C-terminal hydrolase